MQRLGREYLRFPAVRRVDGMKIDVMRGFVDESFGDCVDGVGLIAVPDPLKGQVAEVPDGARRWNENTVRRGARSPVVVNQGDGARRL